MKKGANLMKSCSMRGRAATGDGCVDLEDPSGRESVMVTMGRYTVVQIAS